MHIFDLLPRTKETVSILCLGAHCDDIEIGCGGTLLQLLARHQNISCTWVTFCSTPEREAEAREVSSAFLAKTGNSNVVIHSFRDGFLPWSGPEVKDAFEALKKVESPDLIFTHSKDDMHQDHRLIAELTWNTFRNHLILEYEIPKYDGDMGRPNLYISLEESLLAEKIRMVFEGYRSQRTKQWFTEDLFRSLPRIRGMESNSPTCYAEAFYCRKLLAM
jgi:LmbE family N-acetylglucosaminyl deacetylase